MKIDRLSGLLSILANTDQITVQELADRFEVSRRTIFRDLDALSRAGIPITSCPGLGGGVSVIEGYKLNNQMLSDGDKAKLFTALNGLKSLGGDDSVTNLIAKLVPENEADFFTRSNYVIDFSSWFSDSIAHEKALKLHQAICGNRCVSLEYISKNSRSVRTVEPCKLVFKQSHWYLYAFCREKEEFRLFRLNRIVWFEILDQQFHPRPVNNIEFVSYYGEELFSAHEQDGFEEVILEYEPQDAFELTEKVDASFFRSRKDGGACPCEIRFYTSDLHRTAVFILGFAHKVRVVSPPELIGKIRELQEGTSLSNQNNTVPRPKSH